MVGLSVRGLRAVALLALLLLSFGARSASASDDVGDAATPGGAAAILAAADAASDGPQAATRPEPPPDPPPSLGAVASSSGIGAAVAAVGQTAAPPPPGFGLVTPAQARCLAAIGYEVCTQDPTGACAPRFYVERAEADPAYQRRLFAHLLGRYLRDARLSSAWLLSQVLSLEDLEAAPLAGEAGGASSSSSPLPPPPQSYAARIDAMHGSECASDPGVAGVLLPKGRYSAAQAEAARLWWRLWLRRADFCLENHMFVEGEGCVCRENNSCDEAFTPRAERLLWQTVVTIVVLAAIVLWSIHRAGQQVRGLRQEYAATAQGMSVLATSLREAEAARRQQQVELLQQQPRHEPRAPPSSSSSSSDAATPTPAVAASGAVSAAGNGSGETDRASGRDRPHVTGPPGLSGGARSRQTRGSAATPPQAAIVVSSLEGLRGGGGYGRNTREYVNADNFSDDDNP